MQRRDPHGTETAAVAAAVELRGRRIVEVGCGRGRLTPFLAARAAELYAFDPSDESVTQARASLPAEVRDRVRFGVHDAEAIDVPRRHFDLAVCGWSL